MRPTPTERSEAMSMDEHERGNASPTGEGAFESIFLRYYPLVYRLAYRYVGQPDEAEDIAQEVFLRFYHLPPHADNESQRRAWLCRVAINLGLNALRKRRSRVDQEWASGAFSHEREREWEREWERAEEQNPERLLLVEEQAAQVRDTLARLPERQQVCLLLRGAGCSYEEITEATGIPVTSVGSVLARAMQAFRRNYHERTHATQTTK